MHSKTSQDNNISVIVPAAGVGKRMGADCPKQYLKINDITILEHTVNRLLAHPKIHQVILALGEDDTYFAQLDIAKNPKVIRVPGGKERADSVLSGLEYLNENQSDSNWVMVHDAARPCISHHDISKLIEHCLALDINLDTAQGAILAAPVRDTMKRTNAKQSITNTVPRDGLWHALTPQMFPSSLLLNALSQGLTAGKNITDEASAMELAGFEVDIVAGRSDNLKVTSPEDLALAQFYLTTNYSTFS